MNRKLFLFLLIAIVASVTGRPQNSESTVAVTTSTTSATVTTSSGGSSTAATPAQESKVSKFFDDVSSVFKQGTARVKESFESAASSVKDGVMRGYDYVKDKLTGSGDTTTTPNNGSSVVPPTTKTTTTEEVAHAKVSEISETFSARSAGATVNSVAKAVNVEPNDEEVNDENEDRLIFIGDEETGTDPPPTTTESKAGLDDRFIIDGPKACKIGQSEVNGKCRNTF
ncbi:uncharacterized protein LOC131425266 [Malaya genurostris]|uniref:uncharacterized protein LOC131425266 n=1 Tax=Malaya genurostris TaxID=325434 RepID=UPI0026F3C408|nr:uncharacterized protein LOC131425266 [Malaya genurostris]